MNENIEGDNSLKTALDKGVGSSSLLSAIHEIEGYGIVLPLVQNYYPVEKDAGIWCWGFKYKTGVFEYFHHQTKEVATAQRSLFVAALEEWYISSR